MIRPVPANTTERDSDYDVIARWLSGDAEPFFGLDRTGPNRFTMPLAPRMWRERAADALEDVATWAYGVACSAARAVRGRR